MKKHQSSYTFTNEMLREIDKYRISDINNIRSRSAMIEEMVWKALKRIKFLENKKK